MNKNKLSFFTLIGKIKFRLFEKIDQKTISKLRNIKLKNKDFTIISNNCFGGWVYRIYNLPYMTPTIGLFIMPEDYLKFIKNLNYYLSLELEFIDFKESRFYDYLSENVGKFGKYPIGRLDDIEIQFLHYEDEIEAREKWNRRKKRINKNNIIYKFNDQNGCKKEQIKEFCDLNSPNKLCFVSNKEYKNIDGVMYVKEFKKNNFVIDDTWFARKYINLNKFINNIVGLEKK